MDESKIYQQPKRIIVESQEFFDGEINYQEIEIDANNQVILGLSREDQKLFGFPEGSDDEEGLQMRKFIAE